MPDQELESQLVQDTKLQQKLGLVYRQAFAQKFPQQTEHIMRLIAERLQLGLKKDLDVELPARDIDHLASALLAIYTINSQLKK